MKLNSTKALGVSYSNSQTSYEEDFFNGRSDGKHKSNRNKSAKNYCEKDFGLNLFHALGKFLYNKRINPKTGKEERMTSHQLKTIKPKPKCYVRHLDVLQQVRTDNTTFSLFLYENVPSFYKDIEDMAKVLEVYSCNDAMMNRSSYNFANQKYIDEIQEVACQTECLAVTEFNIHGYEENNGTARAGRPLPMAKPEWFDFRRKLNETKSLIFDTLKFDQSKEKTIFSEDIMIGSYKKAVTDYLPFFKQMGLFNKVKLLSPLKSLVEFGQGYNSYRKNEFDESELENDNQDQEFIDSHNAKLRK